MNPKSGPCPSDEIGRIMYKAGIMTTAFLKPPETPKIGAEKEALNIQKVKRQLVVPDPRSQIKDLHELQQLQYWTKNEDSRGDTDRIETSKIISTERLQNENL